MFSWLKFGLQRPKFLGCHDGIAQYFLRFPAKAPPLCRHDDARRLVQWLKYGGSSLKDIAQFFFGPETNVRIFRRWYAIPGSHVAYGNHLLGIINRDFAAYSRLLIQESDGESDQE